MKPARLLIIVLTALFCAGFSYSQQNSGQPADSVSAVPKQQINYNQQRQKEEKNFEAEHLTKDFTASSSAAFNKLCPVMGNKVNSKANTVQYKGKTYGFCCNGCDRKFINDPEKYTVNLNDDGTKFKDE